MALNPKADNQQALVLYHYYEKDQSYIDNFAHFLRFGYDSNLDYLIVIAGKCSLDLPSLDNVQYFFSENKNFDYGGYCAAIQTLDLWQRYDFYLLTHLYGPHFFQLTAVKVGLIFSWISSRKRSELSVLLSA